MGILEKMGWLLLAVRILGVDREDTEAVGDPAGVGSSELRHCDMESLDNVAETAGYCSGCTSLVCS